VKIEILDVAQEDLIEGFRFYEMLEVGLGSYFLDCLFSDIDSLLLYSGIQNHLWISPIPVEAIPFCHLLQCRGRFDSYTRSFGLSIESIVD